jgi:hypothetical protein
LFRAADCDTGHYLVVEKITERLPVSKQTMHGVHVERFKLKKLNKAEGKGSIILKYQIGSHLWKT